MLKLKLDIRFIYIHNDHKKYLSLKTLKDSIDGFSEDRLYDWNGWDIIKALKLLSQTNPSIVEWLYSPIVYHKNDAYTFVEQCLGLIEEEQRLMPLVYHYRSMAKANYKTHIENKNLVKIKKYLYVIRPAGMVEWLLKCKKQAKQLVKIDFNDVLVDLKECIPIEVYSSIKDVIEKKKTLKELDEEPRVFCLDNWIESILKYTDDDFKNLNLISKERKSLDDYDTVLHNLLDIKL